MNENLAQLFPSNAVIVKAHASMWNTPLCKEEEALIEAAVEKRQKEFRAGRHAAHQALEQLNAPWHPLLREDNRQPIWPPGYIGSITHCRDACVAVCAKSKDLIGLGVDVEPLEPLPKGVDRYIHTAVDSETMRSIEILPERLIFSAKESIYKCYHPLIGQHMGFQSVSLEIDPENMTFKFVPTESSTIPFPEGLQFHGRYLVDSSHLYTGCFLSAV
ncbi:MAG: 4'-phosphopantetheinyl transferase superfamily protein [Candidatus Thiodiazotropha sp. LLP2]